MRTIVLVNAGAGSVQPAADGGPANGRPTLERIEEAVRKSSVTRIH